MIGQSTSRPPLKPFLELVELALLEEHCLVLALALCCEPSLLRPRIATAALIFAHPPIASKTNGQAACRSSAASVHVASLLEQALATSDRGSVAPGMVAHFFASS
jgi:hypothetical protein